MTLQIATLRGACVLILEDDYYLAVDLQDALEAAGASVAGPFSEVGEARDALEASRPDCAFIDVNLGYGPSFELPAELRRLDVPFAFVTGYDSGVIPIEFDAVERLEKPIEARRIAAVASRLLGRDEVTSR